MAAVDASPEALEKLLELLGRPENLLTIKTDISNEESCGKQLAKLSTYFKYPPGILKLNLCNQYH